MDHIREGLKKDPSFLLRTELPADFRIVILEQQHLNDMLAKLDFKNARAPVPAGGLYGYEQQRRLFNPTDRPLMQPYAAYSGGEFVTVAIENLMRQYLGGKLINALGAGERERAERAAREEVDRTIAQYCANRPDRQNIQICTTAADR